MILPYDVISRNKWSSSSVIQTRTWRFLFYFVLFIIIQILTLVCKINGIAVNSPRAHENCLCLGCRLWLSLVFSTIYRVVLIYVYFWSNLLFSILTSLLFISIYLRKYKLSVVKYPRQFKWMQLEIERQLFLAK